MTREYVVQRIGDTYVTVPVDHYPNATRTAFGIWACVLLLLGLNRSGRGSGALFIGSGLMAYRAATDRSLLPVLFGCSSLTPDSKNARPSLSPSYQNDYHRKAGQMPADPVDEAVMESFPASDPPARMTTAVAK